MAFPKFMQALPNRTQLQNLRFGIKRETEILTDNLGSLQSLQFTFFPIHGL